MQFLLDNDVDTPTRQQQYPVTDLVRTYLQRTGSKFYGPGSARREEPVLPAKRTVQDLWDYLGDFA
jgi:hypothetical protein